MPTGDLYAWTNNSLVATLSQNPVAMLPTLYYQNPTQLITATAPGALSGLSANITGSAGSYNLSVTDSGFLGTAMISVTGSDGLLSTTQTILVTFTDTAPTLAAISNQTYICRISRITSRSARMGLIRPNRGDGEM